MFADRWHNEKKFKLGHEPKVIIFDQKLFFNLQGLQINFFYIKYKKGKLNLNYLNCDFSS